MWLLQQSGLGLPRFRSAIGLGVEFRLVKVLNSLCVGEGSSTRSEESTARQHREALRAGKRTLPDSLRGAKDHFGTSTADFLVEVGKSFGRGWVSERPMV